MSFFISDAFADAASGSQSGGWEALLFPLGLVVIFYLFLIRPQMKRQKEHRRLVQELQKGDEVQMQSGLMGKIADINDTTISLEVTNNLVLKFRRTAVETVLPKGTLQDQ
jgi:preprotein translocase subunit YajC